MNATDMVLYLRPVGNNKRWNYPLSGILQKNKMSANNKENKQ